MHDVRAESDVARAAAEGGEEKEKYVRRIFSEIAPRYDFLNHLLSLNIDRGWRRKAIAALGWRDDPGGTYLDLCAGTLDIALMLARESGFRGHVVGADFAEPMLKHGVRKIAGRSAYAVAGDATALPLPADSVDGAIVAFGIRNVASLDTALREILRVLRPGRRFVILEFSTPRAALVRFFYLLYFNRILPVIGRLVSGHRTAYSYLPDSVAHFPTGDRLALRMREAGFGEVTWRALSHGIAAIHVGAKPAGA